ncbi:hypothetical protein Patl1_29843 [Pistacia atlantica]|uniref:Uncharacterized protein n=1 Tax=Pistacia atlantica TaxID=434234 RepID=A0ACC1ABN9_9ROSI|nr:hypothetical protein Patl1_29843 [Pistacia atlantica]
MHSLVGNRLPKFSEEESKLLKGSSDFLGLNYYTALYAAYAPQLNSGNKSYSTDPRVNQSTSRNGIPIGPKAASDWLYIYPRGIWDLLLYTKKKYNNPLIYITENGIDEANNATLSLEEALVDNMRIDYYYQHLSFLQRAIKDGVNVKGYFAWSLLDNFEWFSGYTWLSSSGIINTFTIAGQRSPPLATLVANLATQLHHFLKKRKGGEWENGDGDCFQPYFHTQRPFLLHTHPSPYRLNPTIAASCDNTHLRDFLALNKRTNPTYRHCLLATILPAFHLLPANHSPLTTHP